MGWSVALISVHVLANQGAATLVNFRAKGLFAIASNPLTADFTEPVATCLTCDPTSDDKGSRRLRVPQPAVLHYL